MSLITGMFAKGVLQAVERSVQFSAARHRVLTHNIANLSTPYFKPRDLDPAGFQKTLADAIDRRRRLPNPVSGRLNVRDTRELRFDAHGLRGAPQRTNDNILFHDQNNRDLDRMMQRLAENTLAHNTGVELARNQFDMLRLAIRERI